jgi:hypothetical protein
VTDAPDPDEPVPRLPRGRGITLSRLSRPEMFRIVGMAALLVFLLVAQRPCADAVSRFVTSFGDNGSAAAPLPRPGTVDLPAAGAGSDYEPLRPGMSDAEIKAAIERARARAHTGSAAGSNAGSDAPAPALPPPSPPAR